MTHVLVTGAGGFVGRALVQRLLNDAAALPRAMTTLTAVDQQFGPTADTWRSDPRVRLLEGDFGAAAVLDEALSPAPDAVFHLASVPGSRAEREQALGLQVNLLAPIALFQRLAERVPAGAVPPRVVFASSIAVYGGRPASGRVDESATPRPGGSYGAHKRMTEILLADMSRRRVLDAVSLRLPGIVARPPAPTGHGSAFLSDIIRRLCACEPYECPVSPAATAWWMSLPCCVDNLLHAARLDSAALDAERCVQLPVLCASIGELVEAIEAETGRPARISYRPDERTEAIFGRLPPLDTPEARRLGFRDDASLAQLLRAARH